MDPALEAAAFINRSFKAMGVPCEVRVTKEKGKHVVATEDIPAHTDLFDEVPIASWPAPGYLLLKPGRFCFTCLRTDAGNEEQTAWSQCDDCDSEFCSPACRFRCSAVPQDDSLDSTCEHTTIHGILCKSLKSLREHKDQKPEATTNEGITVEALARCVAYVISRMASIIVQQSLSSPEDVVDQVFAAATKPFNRLVDCPGDASFDFDTTAWFDLLREQLTAPCVRALCHVANLEMGEDSSSSSSSSAQTQWVRDTVAAVLRADTLETMLGQLSLNSQGINTAIPSSSGTLTFMPVLKGCGVYTLQSTFNHSCRPNAVVNTPHGTHEITIQTTHDIKQGDEMNITYIPLETLPGDTADDFQLKLGYKQRREQLQAYFFTCNCEVCATEERKEKEAQDSSHPANPTS